MIEFNPDIIDLVFGASDNIVDNRDSYAILSALVSEVGELATEVGIQRRHINKPEGPDGILGESIDVILCALDMIRKEYPYITKAELLKIAHNKCLKWENGKNNGNCETA